MNRIITAKIIQRVLFVIVLLAVAHTARPFTVRDVTRHLFRTTQSLSFVLPGVAVCTMERADYLASIFDGGLQDGNVPFGMAATPQSSVKDTDLALVNSQPDFNPEHDSVPAPVSDGQGKAATCPLSAKRGAGPRTGNSVAAKSRANARLAGEVIAVNLIPDASALPEPVSRIAAPELPQPAPMVAVALPQAPHPDVHLAMQNDLSAVRSAVQIFTRTRRNYCDPVLPEIIRVRAALEQAKAEASVSVVSLADLRAQTAVLQKAVSLQLTLEWQPAGQPRKVTVTAPRTCTLNDQVVKC